MNNWIISSKEKNYKSSSLVTLELNENNELLISMIIAQKMRHTLLVNEKVSLELVNHIKKAVTRKNSSLTFSKENLSYSDQFIKDGKTYFTLELDLSANMVTIISSSNKDGRGFYIESSHSSFKKVFKEIEKQMKENRLELYGSLENYSLLLESF